MPRNRLAQSLTLLTFALAVGAAAVFGAAPPDLSSVGLTVLADVPAAADGRHYTIYRSSPGAAAPTTLPATPNYEIWSPLTPVAGLRYGTVLRELPAPTTAPVTQPAPKPADLVYRVAGIDPRGDGLDVGNRATPQSLANLYFQGFEQNLVVWNVPSVTIDHVISVAAYRGKPADVFNGQGGYYEKIPGPLTITNSYFARNGWQPDKPAKERNGFRHGGYFNFSAAGPVISDTIFAENSGAGVQTRNGGHLTNCLLEGNAISALAIMGTLEIDDSLILGGHYYAENDPDATGTIVVKSWTANAGLMAYHPVKLRRCKFVGLKGQGDVPVSLANAKAFPSGCIVTGGNYGKPEWRPPVDAAGKRITKLIDAKDCEIDGWPGQAFAGAAPHDGSGFDLRPNAAIDYDPAPILADVEANRINPRDAIARIKADVAAKLAAAPNN